MEDRWPRVCVLQLQGRRVSTDAKVQIVWHRRQRCGKQNALKNETDDARLTDNESGTSDSVSPPVKNPSVPSFIAQAQQLLQQILNRKDGETEGSSRDQTEPVAEPWAVGAVKSIMAVFGVRTGRTIPDTAEIVATPLVKDEVVETETARFVDDATSAENNVVDTQAPAVDEEVSASTDPPPPSTSERDDDNDVDRITVTVHTSISQVCFSIPKQRAFV